MLEFELVSPNKSEKLPLVIFLHGYGANRFDLISLSDLFPNCHCISLEAPIEMGYNQSCWYNIKWTIDDKIINTEEAINSKNKLVNFIENDLDKLGIAFIKENITLFGFSQGGIMSYAVASELAYIHKVFAISSYFDKNIADINGLNNKELSIFACHGAKDIVIPIKEVRNSQDIISAYKLKNYKYIEHSEGHWIPQNIINEIIEWNDETN